MNTQFRESLAADVMVGIDQQAQGAGIGLVVPVELVVADAILRSPEMQQIRITLRRMAAVLAYQHVISSEHDDAADVEHRRRDALINYGLSDHVIAWVME